MSPRRSSGSLLGVVNKDDIAIRTTIIQILSYTVSATDLRLKTQILQNLFP
jgi:hypothetical protein